MYENLAATILFGNRLFIFLMNSS